MPSLKDLRVRIRSVRSTQKITSAMKVVAASRLRRAHEQVEAARPYAERMERVLGSLAGRMAGLPGAPPLLVGTDRDETHLLVVATSDRGLGSRGSDLRIRALRGGDPGGIAAEEPGGANLYGTARKRSQRARGADDGDGQCHPQRRRHDRPPHPQLQPYAPSCDYQGADRDHL